MMRISAYGDSQWMSTLLPAVLIVVGVWSFKRWVGELCSPLAPIPNIHWLARWTGLYNLHLKYYYNIRVAHYDAHVRGKDGFQPILRVGPNEVSVMDTEAIKAVWGKGFERSAWYQVFQNFGVPNMFSFPSSKDHSERKRAIASAYSKTAISQHRTQKIIKGCTAKLVEFLDKQTANATPFSSPVVVRNVFRALQSDIFSAFAFSERAGTTYLDGLKNGPNTLEDLGMADMDLLHDERRDAFFFWESEKPFKYLRCLVDRSGPQSHARAQRWLSELIRRHEYESPSMKAAVETRSTDSSVYERLRCWRSRHGNRAMTSEEKASEVMDHAVAGQDAVSAALEYTVRQISAHSGVQSRLRLELLHTLPGISSERTFAMIDSLPYLNAVIMECLRTVDTIASYQTRIVPKGGCVICGQFVPEGTTVASQPYLMNRTPDVFPRPNDFDPSRWLLSSADYKNLARHLWTYSSGPRSCIGRELSLAVMKTTLVDIYLRFETRLLNPARFEKRPWEGADLMAEIGFRLANDPRRMTVQGCQLAPKAVASQVNPSMPEQQAYVSMLARCTADKVTANPRVTQITDSVAANEMHQALAQATAKSLGCHSAAIKVSVLEVQDEC